MQLVKTAMQTNHLLVIEETRNKNSTIGIHTSPLGNDPGFVDWCIISSNWNVFDPGAAHTAYMQKE